MSSTDLFNDDSDNDEDEQESSAHASSHVHSKVDMVGALQKRLPAAACNVSAFTGAAATQHDLSSPTLQNPRGDELHAFLGALQPTQNTSSDPVPSSQATVKSIGEDLCPKLFRELSNEW